MPLIETSEFNRVHNLIAHPIDLSVYPNCLLAFLYFQLSSKALLETC
jgi:hypothetical protein